MPGPKPAPKNAPHSSKGGAAPFPLAWQWWADEALPEWVKKHYSPRESWKSKPFGAEDAQFFFKGIEELSALFTEERPARIPQYFNHPKFRSSYLLYFLPLQAAKFLALFEQHRPALDAALAEGRRLGVLRVADLGAGPGTASLALLLKLLSLKLAPGEELPRIEFDWLDTNKAILDDGAGIAEGLASHFPRLRGKVTVRTHVAPWWEAPRLIPEPAQLTLMGHVLNEAGGPQHGSAAWGRLWTELLGPRLGGGGLLCVEPAARGPSQLISRLRDQWIAEGLIGGDGLSLWGPCLHTGICPLAEGRDWCHFSVATHIPGRWFREFSEGLGSERQWVKYSYLWIASKAAPAPKPAAGLRRVISDPLSTDRAATTTVLICEPGQPGRHPVSPRKPLWRGDVVQVGGGS